jgi:hypothetical protein
MTREKLIENYAHDFQFTSMTEREVEDDAHWNEVNSWQY